MEELDVQCESCGEEFEADAELAGEVVECPECGADILIPSPDDEEGAYEEEDDVDEVIEEVRPARKPRKGGRPKERAGGGRGSRSAKGRSRPSRRGGGGGTSNLPLILGGAGAALVLLIVVVALAMSSGSSSAPDDDGGGDDGASSSSSSGSRPPKVDKSKRKLYEKALAEAEGADDPSLWVEAGDLAEEAGLPDEAKAAWRRALDVKEEYKPALSRLGYKKFARSADAEEYEIESPEAFDELAEYEGKWHSPEEYERLRKREKEIIASIKKQIEDRANDPYYDAAVQVERVLSKRKGLSSRVWQKKTDRPYLVFEDKGPKGGAAASSAETSRKLDEKLRHLKFLFEYLMKRWFRPLGFKLDEKTPLVVLSLQDRAAFDKMHQEMGMRIPRGALAYFHRIHKYIILYNGAFGDANLAAQTASQGVLFHEGTHQIVNAVLNAGKGFDSTDAVYLPYWLNEGIAEYVGSLELSDDSDADGNDLYIPGSLNKMRLAEFYMALHPERTPMAKRLGIKHSYAVDVRRLLECHDRASTASAIAKMYDDPAEGQKASAIFGTGLPYYQGTYFFYFCYNFQDGKYGKRFDRFLASAFKGLYYEDNFKEAFSGVDLDQLSREWFGFVEKLAQEHLRR